MRCSKERADDQSGIVDTANGDLGAVAISLTIRESDNVGGHRHDDGHSDHQRSILMQAENVGDNVIALFVVEDEHRHPGMRRRERHH